METDLPGSFRILPEPIPVPPAVSIRLSKILLAESSYAPFYKPCVFEPGISFRFWKGTAAIDVFLCFQCDDLAFQPVGSPGALGGGKLSFDPSRTELALLVREARPDDKRYQALD
jgi:hypothetical protein